MSYNKEHVTNPKGLRRQARFSHRIDNIAPFRGIMASAGYPQATKTDTQQNWATGALIAQAIPPQTRQLSGKTMQKAVATAYSCGGITTDAQLRMNCPSKLKHPNGMTASGIAPIAGDTVACPPSMLGKTIYITGLGKRTCHDIGGAITRGRIDIYVATIAEAFKYGRQEIQYTID